jgi:hypothetical protein
MRTTATIYTRRFPVTIRDERTGAEMQDYITLDKAQIQAAQLVGLSSKELILDPPRIPGTGHRQGRERAD